MIWLKTGADKQRENSKDVLRRLFQLIDQFHADGLPAKARIDKLDKLHSQCAGSDHPSPVFGRLAQF